MYTKNKFVNIVLTVKTRKGFIISRYAIFFAIWFHLSCVLFATLGIASAQIFDVTSSSKTSVASSRDVERNSVSVDAFKPNLRKARSTNNILEDNSQYLIVASKMLRPNTVYQVSIEKLKV